MSLSNVGMAIAPEIAKWGGVAALGLGGFGLLLGIATETEGPGGKYLQAYLAYLDSRLRSMFIVMNPSHIVVGQLGGIFLLVALCFLLGFPTSVAVVVAVLGAVGPYAYIERMKKTRVVMIEAQVESLLVGLANALKTTPSIGAAFQSVIEILPAPMSQEIELMMKEVKVGSTLEEGLLGMARRIGSPLLDNALSSILIGRQVGGNLPKILERTAETLREMNRLDGMLRTKTAEGKFQLYFIAVMPLGLLLGFSVMWEGYFAPLQSGIGLIVSTVAILCWGAGIILARRILQAQL